MTMLLRTLSYNYQRFESQLLPDLLDIRPAAWFSEQTGHSIKLEPGYTAMIDISPRRPMKHLIQDFARNRRRDIKNASNSAKPLKIGPQRSDIFQLYLDQLASKGAKQLALSREKELFSILSAAENGRGFVLKYRIGSEPLSGFICCLKASRTAAAVAMASTQGAKREGLTSWMISQAIETAREHNLRRFDFSGANSPLGATEKHGYGALARLYFNMHFQRSTKAHEENHPEINS
jgi:lipid II:glycine glycyltransferase (peptidoglycan interpeptide bridge formation enzyme)